jgi:hypothetical protein
MITWPAWLPAPNIDFSDDVSQASVRTQMESGRFRQRTRFQRQNRTMSVTWTLDDDQRAGFTSLFKYSLNGGNDWFYMTLPLVEGMTVCTVRFIASSYSEKHEAILHWKISAKMEMQDQVAPLSAEEIEFMLELESLDAFHLAVEAITEAEALYP